MSSETKVQLPRELTLADGAMAMDGGSLGLRAVDEAGEQVSYRLDWSIRAHREDTTQFYVNEKPIPRGSPEEAAWLALLRSAAIHRPSASPTPPGTRISENRVVLSDDIVDYFEAIKRGPETAILWLARQFVAKVSSATYQEGNTLREPPPPPDDIRSLVMTGKTVEAIRAYRLAHPDVGMMAARAAVHMLVSEATETAQPSLAPAGAARSG